VNAPETVAPAVEAIRTSLRRPVRARTTTDVSGATELDPGGGKNVTDVASAARSSVMWLADVARAPRDATSPLFDADKRPTPLTITPIAMQQTPTNAMTIAPVAPLDHMPSRRTVHPLDSTQSYDDDRRRRNGERRWRSARLVTAWQGGDPRHRAVVTIATSGRRVGDATSSFWRLLVAKWRVA